MEEKSKTKIEDFNSAIKFILQKVCEMTGWIAGEAWLLSQDGEYLECCPAWYSSIEGLEEFRIKSEGLEFPMGVGLPGRAWFSKEPVWTRDATQTHDFLRATIAREVGIKAAMAIPLLAADEVIAVLVFFASEIRDEDKRLIKIVSTIANQSV